MRRRKRHKGLRMELPRIGIEIEFHLIDKKGSLANVADALLTDKERPSSLRKELTHAMVEVVSPPSVSIQSLAEIMKLELQRIVRTAEKYDVALLPSTTIGLEEPHPRRSPLDTTKRSVLGHSRRIIEGHICGTHTHQERHGKDLEQYVLMTAMDPSFSFLSSTPFFRGHNSLKDYRVHLYRNVVYSHMPLQGGLLPYARTGEELEARHKRIHEEWRRKCAAAGAEEFPREHYRATWGPLRFTDQTIEARCGDTNLLSNVMAFTALYAGMNRQTERLDLETMRYEGKELPAYEKLLALQEAGISKGLANSDIKAYLLWLVRESKKGLKEEERRYLEPLEGSLQSERTFSDEITEFARKHKFYAGSRLTHGFNDIRRFIADRFIEDLEAFNI